MMEALLISLLGSKITWVASAIALYKLAIGWYSSIEKEVSPLIKRAEELAKDGIIDKNDRQMWVLETIKYFETQGKIKMNFFSRLILKFVINKVAEKLPDIVLSQEVKDVILADLEKR